jgi:dGTPase
MLGLASYAARPETSRGRVHPEPPPEFRSEYQRDRDRVIHSSAFRRLEYKTQVFVNHEGDMFRTRLTHSIEVSQIGRSIARALTLNEDLTEAICLSHDLGHTPFGHAGQDALNECMRAFGGFEHNLQSLRVVDVLEEKYAAFSGLNLTYETREGILKHCSKSRAEQLGELGSRFLNGGQPGLEAQIANIADEIAYNNHDVDDGLRAGLLDIEQLGECRLVREQLDQLAVRWPDLPERRLTHELVRHMIDYLVSDLVRTSAAKLAGFPQAGADDVRAAGEPLIVLSAEARERHLELKRFLSRNLYRHYRVQRMSYKAARVVTVLFETFMEEPRLLPADAQQKISPGSKAEDMLRARIIADYIAGMTDRYAIAEYERLTDPRIGSPA